VGGRSGTNVQQLGEVVEESGMTILRLYTLNTDTGVETVEEITLTPELICAVYAGICGDDGYNNWQSWLTGLVKGTE
jgi:hypothetical protein